MTTADETATTDLETDTLPDARSPRPRARGT